MRTPTQKPKTESEMQQARVRLRGALNETLRGSDEEEDVGDCSGENFVFRELEPIKQPTGRGRPPKVRRDSSTVSGMVHSPRSLNQEGASPSKLNLTPSKRRKREEQLALQQMQRIQAESFVMKLFDRSLDLSKYTECTELYPICRAWMANQPRNLSIQCCRNRRSPSPVVREANGIELLTKLKRGEIREVTAMPAPEETDLPKLPIPEQEECAEAVVEAAKKLKNACKEDLLASHMGKWKRVKTNWVKHTKRYQQRYELNHMIIQELFKP